MEAQFLSQYFNTESLEMVPSLPKAGSCSPCIPAGSVTCHALSLCPGSAWRFAWAVLTLPEQWEQGQGHALHEDQNTAALQHLGHHPLPRIPKAAPHSLQWITLILVAAAGHEEGQGDISWSWSQEIGIGPLERQEREQL